MSGYLAKNGYSVDQISAAASQWLRFIRPDYYVGIKLTEQGVNRAQLGFAVDGSCDLGRCNYPFYTEVSSQHIGGCGGMQDLVG